MSNINKVIFDGRISRAPELKYLQTGTAIANFSVAVSGRKNRYTARRKLKNEHEDEEDQD